MKLIGRETEGIWVNVLPDEAENTIAHQNLYMRTSKICFMPLDQTKVYSHSPLEKYWICAKCKPHGYYLFNQMYHG